MANLLARYQARLCKQLGIFAARLLCFVADGAVPILASSAWHAIAFHSLVSSSVRYVSSTTRFIIRCES